MRDLLYYAAKIARAEKQKAPRLSVEKAIAHLKKMGFFRKPIAICVRRAVRDWNV